jgi:hypothetical protein
MVEVMSLRGVKIGDWLIVNGPLRRPSEARLIQGTAITESTKVVAGG